MRKVFSGYVYNQNIIVMFPQFSFLDLFSTLRPKAESAIPGRCLLFSCWLQLLINLTKYNDGQQMVLKQPGELKYTSPITFKFNAIYFISTTLYYRCTGVDSGVMAV